MKAPQWWRETEVYERIGLILDLVILLAAVGGLIVAITVMVP